MADKKDFQKKLMEMRMIENGLHALREREAELIRVVEDLNRTKEAIEAMESYNGDGTLIPLGSGNFVRGKIEDSDKILVGIGAGVAVKKSREDAIDHIQVRIDELEDSLGKIAEQNNSMISQMLKLREDIQG